MSNYKPLKRAVTTHKVEDSITQPSTDEKLEEERLVQEIVNLS